MNDQRTYFVLVPFYDNVAYLRETVASVVAQTDPEWRVIVIDDSVLPSNARDVVTLVDELHDPRVSTVRNETNLGVAAAFNRCFELAVGHHAELAMILHADDVLEPNYIATVRRAHAAAANATCVAPRVTVIGADGAPRSSLPDTVKSWLWPRRGDRLEGERGLQHLARGQFFYCPAVSYRMAKLTLPAWDPKWTQVMDLDLYGRILLTGGSIVLEPTRVFRYRRHEQSMTQINSATMIRTLEETEVCRAFAAQARCVGWRRAELASRLRLTVRLQALMQAGLLLVRWQFADAVLALRLSISR